MALPEVGDFFTADLHGPTEKQAVMHLTRAGDFLYKMFFLGNSVGFRHVASLCCAHRSAISHQRRIPRLRRDPRIIEF
jgi:hypothetical protein